MTTVIKIETYSVALSRAGSDGFGPGQPHVPWLARMSLAGDNWQVFVFFVADDDQAPKNFRSETIQRLFLFLPIERYEPVLDLLRNEAPVMVSFDERDPQRATIGVSNEMVGEGELCCAAVATGPSTGATAQTSRGFDPFDEHADGHSWSNSYALALCAHHVYGGVGLNAGGEFLHEFTERFQPWLEQGTGGSARFDLVSDESLIGGTGLQAVVMSNDRYTIVAFRGTQTIFSPLPLDWMTNLAFAAEPAVPVWSDVGVLVHGGWLVAVDKAYEELLQLIDTHRDGGDKPLWITGHSLGGSLSMILALRLQTTGDHPVQGVHTYGAPPTGVARYRDSYASQGLARRTQRWVNNDDIVPKLPMPLYDHVGELDLIDQTGAISLGTTPTLSPVVSIPDHDMRTYASIIGASLDEELSGRMPLVE